VPAAPPSHAQVENGRVVPEFDDKMAEAARAPGGVGRSQRMHAQQGERACSRNCAGCARPGCRAAAPAAELRVSHACPFIFTHECCCLFLKETMPAHAFLLSDVCGRRACPPSACHHGEPQRQVHGTLSANRPATLATRHACKEKVKSAPRGFLSVVLKQGAQVRAQVGCLRVCARYEGMPSVVNGVQDKR